MFEMNLKVNVPGLPEAINNLADAIRCNGTTVHDVPDSAVEQSVIKVIHPEAAPAENPTTLAVTPVQAQDACTQPVNSNTAPANTAVSVPSAPSHSNTVPINYYTIDQLSVAGAALCEQGKLPQLIALLGKYGVQAVTQLKPTQDVLGSFANELKALGADL